MPIQLLALSIGNTRTRVGRFEDDKLTFSTALANHRLASDLASVLQEAWGPLQSQEDAAVLLASVVPDLSPQVAEIAGRTTGKKILLAETDLPIPVGRQLDRETLVGQDRLLNAAAAYDTLKQACVVVDAGTAITVDFIDGAGTFHGGAIAPGAQLMLDSLHQHTAQLPEITMAAPEEPIGHNTAQAMRSGVYHGLRGMVRELVEQYAQAVGSFPLVIATGGSAELLFANYELIDRLVPDLTLLGLAVTYRRASEED